VFSKTVSAKSGVTNTKTILWVSMQVSRKTRKGQFKKIVEKKNNGQRQDINARNTTERT